MKHLTALLVTLILLGSWMHARAEVKVFAAASLTDVLQALATEYEASSGDKIVFNFAGSNVLARQIEQGAPAELFLSADEAEMDALAKAGLILQNTRRDLLSNSLVIILPKDSIARLFSANDLLKPEFRRIAIGDPETVPAGIYAKTYLERKGMWTSLRSRMIPTENVRAALAAVASSNADAGIVYKTDASVSNRVRIACQIPAAEAPRILYPIALLNNAAHSSNAMQFLNFLESPHAAAVFARYGFLTAEPRQ